jgi:alkanesulfonate monooxygenase SsuD/methylene tetrahydromethanopterin reductase-like flavin-dependent oxidoreductase (luciferase family)
MKIGLQIPSFTWPGGPERLGANLAAIVETADRAGFESIWVMDHLFQIRSI